MRHFNLALSAMAAGLLLAGCQPNGTPSEAQMRTAVEAYIQDEMGGPSTEDNGLKAKIAEFKKGDCKKPKDGITECAFVVKVLSRDAAAAEIINLLKNGKFYKDEKGAWTVHPSF
ncbi:MAG: hypothetical protein U1E87_08960 [Alphaproteobacteria bacterium]